MTDEHQTIDAEVAFWEIEVHIPEDGDDWWLDIMEDASKDVDVAVESKCPTCGQCLPIGPVDLVQEDRV